MRKVGSQFSVLCCFDGLLFTLGFQLLPFGCFLLPGKKEKPGKTTRPWGIPAPLLYLEEGLLMHFEECEK